MNSCLGITLRSESNTNPLNLKPMGPISHSDGHNLPRSVCEIIPGITAQGNDLVMIGKYSV